MKSSIVKYGVIGGAIAAVLFLGPFIIFPNAHTNPEMMKYGEVIGYSAMVLSMLAVFFGIRAYRNQNDLWPFTFLKGLGSGLQITLVATLIFYLGNVLLYEVIAPNFLTEFGEFYKEYMMNEASTEAERQKVLAEFESSEAFLLNGWLYGLLMSFSVFLIGLVISLISAMVLRRGEKVEVVQS